MSLTRRLSAAFLENPLTIRGYPVLIWMIWITGLAVIGVTAVGAFVFRARPAFHWWLLFLVFWAYTLGWLHGLFQGRPKDQDTPDTDESASDADFEFQGNDEEAEQSEQPEQSEEAEQSEKPETRTSPGPRKIGEG